MAVHFSACHAVAHCMLRSLTSAVLDRSNVAIAAEYHHCVDCSDSIRPSFLREQFFVQEWYGLLLSRLCGTFPPESPYTHREIDCYFLVFIGLFPAESPMCTHRDTRD
eukprot:SAG31_NODE_3891_length_3775_cov_4.787813_3_plen_108_part_00